MTVLEPVVQFLRAYMGKTIDLGQIIEGAERPRKPVLRVMDRLVREGYLEEIEDNKIPLRLGEYGVQRRNPTWRIISKPLAEIAQWRPKRRTVRDKIWHMIRARRRFTRAEIVRLAAVKAKTVETMTKLLEANGYLRTIGLDNHRKVYLLVKDPGPNRPIIKEKADD